MIYTTEVCLFFLLSWPNAFIWHTLTTSEYQYATLMLPFYSHSSQGWHCPVIFPVYQHCHLSGPPVSWSGKPRRLHVQSAFGGFSFLNQIIIGLASTRAVTRKEVGKGTYCQSSGFIDLHCQKLLQKTMKVKTQPLIIQMLLVYLLKLLKGTTCDMLLTVSLSITVPYYFCTFQRFKSIFFVLHWLKGELPWWVTKD